VGVKALWEDPGNLGWLLRNQAVPEVIDGFLGRDISFGCESRSQAYRGQTYEVEEPSLANVSSLLTEAMIAFSSPRRAQRNTVFVPLAQH